MPVRVLTVFRVFVFRVFALPDVDRCCARALGGMAFLMGLVAVYGLLTSLGSDFTEL